jgi:hypothetical protein
MKYFIFVLLTILISCKTQQNVTDNQTVIKSKYKNIKIIEGDSFFSGPCEPSIAINPMNSNNIVAGSILDGYHYSFDSGRTWVSKKITSKKGVYGDPCLLSDFDGNFYYLHLSNPDGRAYTGKKFLNQIVIHQSKDGGKTWDDGVGIGKNEPKQQDKEWAVCNPKTNEIYVTWTEFDKYGSINKKNKSRIRFAKSSDSGQSFSKAITISEIEGNAVDDDETTEGAVPAVDLEGNIYVAWAVNDKIYFDRSFDNGETWLSKDRVIAQQPEGWTQDIPGVGRCNGMPVTVADISDSEYSGTIYVNWTDQRNGKNNTDIFLIKSTDKGEHWSEPVKVNLDNTQSHQFFSWMAVDPITGYIYIVYYDRSFHRNNSTDVVLAISKDGGNTFSNEIISEKPFTPVSDIFFGDYNNISAYDGVVRPIWTRYENEKLSVWTALINITE